MTPTPHYRQPDRYFETRAAPARVPPAATPKHSARPFGALYEAVLTSPVQLRLGVDVTSVRQTADTAYLCAAGGEFGPFDLGVCADGTPEVTLYWSLRGDSYEGWLADGLAAWKAAVTTLVPAIEPLLGAIEAPEQLTFARYSDVLPARWHSGRLLYLGDAAHGTSPQLGQGANLALWDAKVLAECLAEADLDTALARYEALRRPVIRYYQWASRWLTPFFQSDSRLLALLRDAFMHPVGRLPGARRYSLETLTGMRGGFVRRMDFAPMRLQAAPVTP